MANTTGKKFGGREKGGVNKVTAEVRERFQMLVENNLTELQEDFKNVTAAERIRFTLEMAKFCLPTLKSIDYKGEVQITERPKITFD